MDYKEPKTRTETKKQGKKDKGPYSAKHVRAATALAEKKVPGPSTNEEPRRKK